MTTDGLSSALTTAEEEDLLPEVVDSFGKAEEPPSRRGRRPWNEMEFGFFWEITVEKVVGESKADALVAAMLSSYSLESFSARENEWFWIYDHFWLLGGDDTRFCL
ncbi:hypothetical protein HID58_028244 [Brassica napus]|uniref:Uncharacterized protein n=1 Tax=Brassica napus TaxID=3708 RepID=A0ABQ8C9S6_BRANA|nr:hypothetical protein HID58_028244 [Brassica napus]